MTMQLFSLGHPCEHQLRRACIGGNSCPLNGYPDAWCCSFIKGKIGFKRDKPCEGPRCRWGFTHPSQSQFEAVALVLNEARPIAAKIEEAEDKDLLTFQIESPHISDTVQCAIYMMRHPSACGRRVGQLLAYAAVKAGEPKLFMQLLKTMKKPVDHYILGAYAYLTNGNPPQPNHPASPNAASGSASMGSSSTTAKGVKGSAVKAAATPSAAKREEIVEELRNDTVDLMNAALSQGGQLVDREDQHLLQATFIQALRQYKKSNKKRHDMLEAALAKFGNRQIPKESPATSTAHPAASQSEEPAEKESGDAPTAADAEPCKAESSATTTAASTHAKASNAAESPAAHPSSRPASTTTPPAASHKGVSNAAPGSGTALNPNSLHPGFKNSPTPSPTAWEKSHSAAGTTPHSNATPAAGVTHHPSTNNSSATTSPRKQSTAASVMHHPATSNNNTSSPSNAEGGSSSGAGLTNVFTGHQNNSSQSTSSHPNHNNSGSSPAGGVGGEHASSITTPSKAVGPHAASTPAAASNGSHTPHAVGGTHPNSAHTHHTNSHGSPNSQSYHGDHTPSHVAPSSTHNGHPSISGTPAHTAPPPPSPHVAAYPTAVSLHSSTPTTTSTSPPLPVPPLQGISTAAALATDRLPRYDPIRYHTPIQPPPLLFGGLFYLQEDNGAPLGPASSKAMPPLPATAITTTAAAAAAAAVPLPAANPWAAAPSSPQPSPSAVSSMLCGLGGAAANTTGAGVFVSESLLEVSDDVWGTGGGVDTSGLEHLSSEVRKELEESWM